ELIKIVEENQLEKTQGQIILDRFSKFLEEATQWEVKAKTLVITDISQIEEMKEAREARLALKNIRVNAENVRKELKEKSLRESRAIDGVANVIKALIIPIEEYLEKQEKFIENAEQAKKDKVNAERELELSKYVADISMYNYKEMSDEVFANLLLTVKKIWDTEQEAIKKAEQNKIEAEKKERAEQERIRIENERLKKEAEVREKELEKERAEQKKKLEAEQLKSKKEAEAREKIEKELKAKKDEEERLKKENEVKAQKEKLDKLEAEKKAELAPDKDKLKKYAIELGCLEVPQLQSKEAKDILKQALNLLNQAIIILKTN
ncbi:MAG: hypothetical protein WC197_06765, partial [Candidatus Gastranaerophilaceae bacterium]